MGQNKQTFSIDLTEDDTDMLEQIQSPASNGNVITKRDTSQLEKKHTSYSPLHVPDVSTVNYLETLQKENPQIETVFIESDDDNTKNLRHQITLHDMVIINPFESSKSLPQTNVNVNPDNKNADSIKKQTSSHSTNETPLRVRPIAPSELNPIFMENSSTIALQDASDKSSRKFLVIPKDLAPILAASLGPITLNIPGIGPINIPKSLVKTQPAPIPVGEQKFLQEQQSKNVVFKNSPKQTIYDPLTDPKYCWRFIRARKRDLDGFSLTDRLGFYKAEQHRSKVCAAKYNEILRKLQLSINSKQNVVKALNKINMGKFKFAKNNSIQRGNKDSLSKHKKGSGYKRNETNFLAKTHRQKASSDSDNYISDNDLLVTKKVVFINEKQHRRGKKMKKHHKSVGNQYDSSNININNFVEKTIPKRGRPKKVEKNSGYQGKSKLLKSKNTRGYQQKNEYSMKSLPSRNPKLKLLETKSENQGTIKLKPCHVPIDYDESVQKALEEYNKYTTQCIKKLTCEVINNLKQFQNVIQPIKPLLVINQEHCHKMNFQDICSKYNIVFPMFENLGFGNLTITNNMFLEYAKEGYIKFVKPNILCKYLAGFREV